MCETRRREGAKLRGDGTKARRFSRTSLPINLHPSVNSKASVSEVGWEGRDGSFLYSCPSFFQCAFAAAGSLAKRSTFLSWVLGSTARVNHTAVVLPSFRPAENRSPLLSGRGLRFRRTNRLTSFSGEKGTEFRPRGSDGRPKHSSGRQNGIRPQTCMRPGRTYVTCQDANQFQS